MEPPYQRSRGTGGRCETSGPHFRIPVMDADTVQREIESTELALAWARHEVDWKTRGLLRQIEELRTTREELAEDVRDASESVVWLRSELRALTPVPASPAQLSFAVGWLALSLVTLSVMTTLWLSS